MSGKKYAKKEVVDEVNINPEADEISDEDLEAASDYFDNMEEIKKYAKKEVVGEVDSRFKEMQKEPHDHKWVQIDKDGTQECKICGLRRSNS